MQDPAASKVDSITSSLWGASLRMEMSCLNPRGTVKKLQGPSHYDMVGNAVLTVPHIVLMLKFTDCVELQDAWC